MGWRTFGSDALPATGTSNPLINSKIQRADHMGIAVNSIVDAIPLYRDVFGGTLITGGDDYYLGLRTIQYKLSNLKIELLEPLSQESYLAKYLEQHGEGFHHMTLFVDDVSLTLKDLNSHGFETVDTDLKSPTWRETFVRPKSGFGCLIQVVDSSLSWSDPHPTMTVNQILNGEWRWWESQVWHISMLPDGYPDDYK